MEDLDFTNLTGGPSKATTTSPISNGSGKLECLDTPSFVVFQSIVDDLLLACAMVAVIFNFLVIFCAIKLFRRNGDTMHLFILNMTLGDLLLTMICQPNELLIRKNDLLKSKYICGSVQFMNWLGLAVSGLSLTLLNIDKLIFFRWPLTYDRVMTKKMATLSCALIWLTSLSFIATCWLLKIVYVASPTECSLQLKPGRQFVYEIFMVVFCVLPVASSLFVSVYLFRLTSAKRNAPVAVSGNDQTKMKNKLLLLCMRGGPQSSPRVELFAPVLESTDPRESSTVKSLVFIFATTMWTSFSLLPYRLMNLARIHIFKWSDLNCEERRMMTWIAWALLYLLMLNPIVNPVITSLIYAPYRNTIKRFLVNIPPGDRAQQPVRDSESTQVRGKNRRRRCSASEQELSHLKSVTEIARISVSTTESRSDLPSTPSTPLKQEEDFRQLGRPKSSCYPATGSGGSLSANGVFL